MTEFPVTSVLGGAGGPSDITAGPDGNVWFIEPGNKIAGITTTGTISEFRIPTAGAFPGGIASGPDGNLWFTEGGANQIGQTTPAGSFTESPGPTANAQPRGIVAGPDGNLWIGESEPTSIDFTISDRIGRMPATPLPGVSTPPSVSGMAKVGQTVTEIAGTWTNAPSFFSYQWERCAPGFTVPACPAIPGATSRAYGLTVADVGWNIRVKETATTAAGGISAPAASAMTPRVQPLPAPVSTTPPTISGIATDGQQLTEHHGTWSNEPITGYGYQWRRCDTSGGSCAAIANATSQTYQLIAADVGHTIRVEETATNPTSTGAAASSDATAVVQAGPEHQGPPPPQSPSQSSKPPHLSALSIEPRAFLAAATGASATAAARKPVGAKVRYRLDVSAEVRFSVERVVDGRQVGRNCVPRTRANNGRRRCSRYQTLPGNFTVTGRSGANSFRFSGRLSGRRLSSGSYRLRATPAANRQIGSSQTTSFSILPAAPQRR